MTMTHDPSITCSEARARWLRGVDEGIEDLVARSHVQSCAECRLFACEMSAVLGGLADLKRATQSVGHGMASTFACAGAASRPRRRLAVPRVLWLVAAALALLVTGAYFGLRPREFARQDVGPIFPPNTVEVSSSPPVSIKLFGQSKGAYLAVADGVSTPNVDVIRLYPMATRTHDQTSDPKSKSNIRSKENHQ